MENSCLNFQVQELSLKVLIQQYWFIYKQAAWSLDDKNIINNLNTIKGPNQKVTRVQEDLPGQKLGKTLKDTQTQQ